MWWFVAAAWAQEVAWPEGDRLLELVNAHPDGDEASALVSHYKLKKQKTWHNLGAKGAGICLATNESAGRSAKLVAHREVSAVWLQDDPDGNAECVAGTFRGTLPFGLRWGQSMVEVRALLGFGVQDPYEERLSYGAGRNRFVELEFRDDRLFAIQLTNDGLINQDTAREVADDTTLWIPSVLGAVVPKAVVAAPADGPVPGGDALLGLLHQPPNAAMSLITAWGLGDLENKWHDFGAVGAGICVAANREEVTSVWLQDDPQGSGECPGGSYSATLPFGLSWGMSPADVQARLGPAVKSSTDLNWDAGNDRFVEAGFRNDRLYTLQLAYSGWVTPAVMDELEKGELGRLAVTVVPVAPRPVPVVSAPVPAPMPVVVSGPAPLPSLDAPARTGAKATTDSAVVVGLESYPFLGAGVPFAKRDAQAFADLMVYTRGVPQGRVQLLTHGAREQILAAIDRAAAETPAGGTVWVYFSGHGAANPQTGDRMLLGDDVRSDAAAFAARGVGVGEIEERLGAKGLQARLVLDACYAGASRSGASILGGTRFAVPTYASKPKVNATQWNAAGPDQISGPLDPVQHGAFTYFAIGALRGWADGELDGTRDGKVTAAEAQAFVSRALRGAGQNDQTPVWVGADDVVLSTGTEPSPLR